MVRPSGAEIADLQRVAREIRDTADESGFSVEKAVGLHGAFSQTRGPASALERSLVLDAARRGASQAGLTMEEVSGGLNIITTTDNVIRRFRVKSVTLTAEGALEVICGLGSSLLRAEPETLLREELWI